MTTVRQHQHFHWRRQLMTRTPPLSNDQRHFRILSKTWLSIPSRIVIDKNSNNNVDHSSFPYIRSTRRYEYSRHIYAYEHTVNKNISIIDSQYTYNVDQSCYFMIVRLSTVWLVYAHYCDQQVTNVLTELQHMMKRRGQRTDSWGTP